MLIKRRISDERFMKMNGNYKAEQHSLIAETEALEAELAKEEKKKTDLRLLFKTVRECTDIKTLTPDLVNSLIRRIEVHAPKKINGKKHVAVDIYFTGVGLFTIPNKNDLETVISEMTRKTA